MDPPAVVSVREKEAGIIGQWIDAFYEYAFKVENYPANIL